MPGASQIPQRRDFEELGDITITFEAGGLWWGTGGGVGSGQRGGGCSGPIFRKSAKSKQRDSLAVGEESRQASLAHCLTLSELVPQLRDRVTAITSLG